MHSGYTRTRSRGAADPRTPVAVLLGGFRFISFTGTHEPTPSGTSSTFSWTARWASSSSPWCTKASAAPPSTGNASSDLRLESSARAKRKAAPVSRASMGSTRTLAFGRYGARSALARVGVYGHPPGDKQRWAKQLAVYLAALMVHARCCRIRAQACQGVRLRGTPTKRPSAHWANIHNECRRSAVLISSLFGEPFNCAYPPPHTHSLYCNIMALSPRRTLDSANSSWSSVALRLPGEQSDRRVLAVRGVRPHGALRGLALRAAAAAPQRRTRGGDGPLPVVRRRVNGPRAPFGGS